MTDWNPDPIILEELVSKLREGFDPNQRGISISGRDYSANEVVQEVEAGTSLGRNIYASHLRIRNYFE